MWTKEQIADLSNLTDKQLKEHGIIKRDISSLKDITKESNARYMESLKKVSPDVYNQIDQSDLFAPKGNGGTIMSFCMSDEGYNKLQENYPPIDGEIPAAFGTHNIDTNRDGIKEKIPLYPHYDMTQAQEQSVVNGNPEDMNTASLDAKADFTASLDAKADFLVGLSKDPSPQDEIEQLASSYTTDPVLTGEHLVTQDSTLNNTAASQETSTPSTTQALAPATDTLSSPSGLKL